MIVVSFRPNAGHLKVVIGGLIGIVLGGCVTPPQKPPVLYSDGAPHAMPPTPKERMFDGSLYGQGGLSDLASDAVAMNAGDPVIIRFGPKNGYPGVPQDRITRLMGQVIREDPPGSLLVSAQRTIRDSSGTRRIVLVGRISRGSIDPGNEVPVSLVSMLRFRADQPSDKERSPQFRAPGVPGKQPGPARNAAGSGVKTKGKTL